MEGKTVLVTGGNSGVGFATASTMYALGAEVVVACRSGEGEEDRARRVNKRVALIL
jgi:dehydrogenase/reductase SDR family protein 13